MFLCRRVDEKYGMSLCFGQKHVLVPAVLPCTCLTLIDGKKMLDDRRRDDTGVDQVRGCRQKEGSSESLGVCRPSAATRVCGGDECH